MNAFSNFLRSIQREPAPASGVVLGSLCGRKLIDASMAPSVVLGPCRSGKGALVLVPSLLNWRGSAVVVEPRGELQNLTAEWRRDRAGNRIYRLTFGGGECVPDTFNLLDGVRRGTPHEVGDIAAITESLLSTGAVDQPHAEVACMAMALAIVAVRAGANATMSDVHSLLAGQGFRRLVADSSNDDLDVNSVVSAWARALRVALANVSAEDFRAAREAAIAATAIFNAPDVRAKTMASTFRLQDLQRAGERSTLYLTCPPDQALRLRPLWTAFLQLMTRHATAEPGGSKWPTLLVLDEFTSLGRLQFLVDEMPALVDCGVKLLLAVNSLQELLDVYASDARVWKRCTTKVIFPPNSLSEAEAVVATLNDDPFATLQLCPDALLRTRRSQALLQRPGYPPTWISATPYYEDPRYQEVAAIVAKANDTRPRRTWPQQKPDTQETP